MLIAVAIVLALVLVVVAVNVRAHARRPSRVARRRLDAQLHALQRQAAALGFVDRDVVGTQEDAVRVRWAESRMRETQIEEVDAHGTGPATYEALREHGIRTLRDLERVASVKVPGIGAKKQAELIAAYRRERARLHDEAKRLDRSALDAFSEGKLGEVVAHHEREELERQRALEAIQIRIRELEHRRARL